MKNAISHLGECVEPEERRKWTESALQDWETFLLCRAKEIKPGYTLKTKNWSKLVEVG